MVSPADFEELPLLLRMLVNKEQRRQSISFPSILASPLSAQRSLSTQRKPDSSLKRDNATASSAFVGLVSPAPGSIPASTVPPNAEHLGAETSDIPAFLLEPSRPVRTDSGSGMPVRLLYLAFALGLRFGARVLPPSTFCFPVALHY